MSEKQIPIYVISDCADPEAQLCYDASFAHEFPIANVKCYGITHPLQAGGFALRPIDLHKGDPAIVFVNYAPRRDKDRKEGYLNGRPFGYFFIDKTLVIASDEPEIWSMFKLVSLPLGVVRKIECEKIPGMPTTQFRSGLIIPKVAKMILFGNLDCQIFEPKVVDVKNKIWHIDNFGNCKTTSLKINKRKYVFEKDLTNLLEEEQSATIGSSGYGDQRFVEFAMKGFSFAESHNWEIGMKIPKSF
ncbi:hypothetical protein IT400_00640 [Candidatus Nomurabacteria bacterium]|nr:hypothetical protein [Candidatus Nomurabacteria bacterium]